jgi:hypothetical protein
MGGSGFSAYAGWYLVQQNSYGDGSNSYTKISIQEHKVLFEEGFVRILYDMNSAEITLANNRLKQYWKGSLPEAKLELNKSIETSIEEQYAQLGQQRALRMSPLIDLFDAKVLDQLADSSARKLRILVNPINNAEILGQDCQAYQVSLGKQVVENLWINPKMNLNNDVDWDVYTLMLDQYYEIGNQAPYRASKAYVDLMKQGIVYRSMNRLGTISELISIQEKRIEDSVFELPADFRLVRIEELLKPETSEIIRN